MSCESYDMYSGARVYHRMSSIKKPGLVFSVDKGTSRCFVRFDSFDDFETWYMLLSPRKKTISEVVKIDMRKLILDIDSPDNTDRLLMYDFERHIVSRINDVFFMLDIGRPNVIFFDMCSDDKISYHAVVSNFVFSAHTCLGLCTIISLGQAWEPCVDKGVYKATQFMRIENSTKFGENRWKLRTTKPGSIRDGMLSDYFGVQVSDFVACSNLTPISGTGVSSIEQEIGLMLSQFKVGAQNKYGTIPLKRVRSGFCIRCNRVHDNENAFIRYVAGVPVFMCWRARATSQ